MTVSAHDVAAELRKRLPGVGVKKLHKLLYYCQGHHVAHSGEPLFSETISAWDMGPVVGSLWKREDQRLDPPPPRPLDEGALNTVGYVLSRYGALTGNDLETLSHGEAPWKLADRDREPRGSTTIKLDWIKGYFQTAGAPGDEDMEPLDSTVVRAWLHKAAQNPGPNDRDDIARLRARMSRSA
ncbi:Panacea domain-containing protein [Actinoplanes sp. NPDC051859]|uniref:Panacea domain-containing protein n=1 Tax=Actinoplanes sp. NPDC051859 TaxID=3363909 RepID=UPI003799E43A